MWRYSFVIAVLVMCLAYQNSRGECTISGQKQIPEWAYVPTTWNRLYQSYRMYGDCGRTGDLAEGYSQAVAQLLSNDWKHLPYFLVLAHEHPDFQEFVIGHIDSTEDERQLRKFEDNAKNHCQSGANEICSAIAKAAARAIRFLNSAD